MSREKVINPTADERANCSSHPESAEPCVPIAHAHERIMGLGYVDEYGYMSFDSRSIVELHFQDISNVMLRCGVCQHLLSRRVKHSDDRDKHQQLPCQRARVKAKEYLETKIYTAPIEENEEDSLQ